MIKIPFDPAVSADQEMNFIGAGVPVTIRLTWNVYSDAWFISIADIAPRRVVPNLPLLRGVRDLAPVPGDFMVRRATSAAQSPIGYDALGASWVLVYMTAQEIEAWGVARGLE